LPHALNSLQKPRQSFESPLKNFSVVVPELPFGTSIEKKSGKDGGTVSFLGATGDIQRIDYQRLPPDFAIPTDSASLQRFAESALQSLLTPYHGTVLADSALKFVDQDAWFALVNFPHAARVVDSTGQRRDATRGLLLFVRNGFGYNLHVEGGVMDTGPGHPLSVPHALELLSRFYQTITFR
jgi:hypothetical protein